MNICRFYLFNTKLLVTYFVCFLISDVYTEDIRIIKATWQIVS